MSHPSITFAHAITRQPAKSIVDGLRAVDVGAPDFDGMMRAHDAYVAALRSTGADVRVLGPLEAFPDAQFVEDTALCLPQGAILMHPGAPSRVGEVQEMAPHLANIYTEMRSIIGGGRIEGGDILVTGREILVGLSDRTNTAGVAELEQIANEWGHRVRTVITPPGVLHFKTDCSLMDPETILSTQQLDASGCFDGYRVLHVPREEEAAANAIRFNDLVIMADGFPRTAEMLDREGFNVVQIDNTDCAKLDGGMSCLSLRF